MEIERKFFGFTLDNYFNELNQKLKSKLEKSLLEFEKELERKTIFTEDNLNTGMKQFKQKIFYNSDKLVDKIELYAKGNFFKYHDLDQIVNEQSTLNESRTQQIKFKEKIESTLEKLINYKQIGMLQELQSNIETEINKQIKSPDNQNNASQSKITNFSNQELMQYESQINQVNEIEQQQPDSPKFGVIIN